MRSTMDLKRNLSLIYNQIQIHTWFGFLWSMRIPMFHVMDSKYKTKSYLAEI